MGKRVFVDFEGVMTASTVYLNGHKLGEYKGGYTPFSFELTAGPILDPSGDNVLAVQVDSTERADIPPFGYEVDYLTFGGIYREVALRIVPETFLDNIFAAPKNVLTKPAVDVKCYLNHPATAGTRPLLPHGRSSRWRHRSRQSHKADSRRQPRKRRNRVHRRNSPARKDRVMGPRSSPSLSRTSAPAARPRRG